MDYLQLAIEDAAEYLTSLQTKKAPHKMTYVKNESVEYQKQKKKMKWFGSFYNMTGVQFKSQLQTWSRRVKSRDENTCVHCGTHYGLNAHHLWHKEWVPESALDVDNGITLCEKCHQLIHTYCK